MTPAKPRDRKCASCRFYEPSPLWRRGWCRNPLLYDPQTNHLVEADSLACSRTFIDYWEARPPGQKGASTDAAPGAPMVRRAPSIPLTPTGPGGAPLRGNGATVAAVQATFQPRDRAPQLSLVKPGRPEAEPETAPAPGDTRPLETIITPSAPTVPVPVPAAAAPSNAVVPGRREPALQEDDRRRTVLVLAGALVIALVVAGLLYLRQPHATTAGNPTLSPTAVALGGALVPTDVPVARPTATPVRRPTVAPTAAPLVLAKGAKAQLSGLNSPLNVRQAASINARVVGILRPNVTVQIQAGPQSADGVTWWQIKGWDAKGTLGWASGKYLKPVR